MKHNWMPLVATALPIFAASGCVSEGVSTPQVQSDEGQTPWLTEYELSRFVESRMQGGKAYATAIDCEERSASSILFKLTVVPFSGPPPFYRWLWVFGETTKLDHIIADIPLSGETQNPYRIVNSNTFTDHAGVQMTCAIIYR
ncbi:hypothetical protein [Consotaella aegiceratis]|uniref:hypothetical protein n=1 Tax=Consotaella aegiceratis TaxID=3097961 RepID=UPI002F3E5107